MPCSSGAKKPSIEEECDCDFSALPQLLFLCHMFLPLLTIPLTWVLIPDIKMTDPIDVGDGYYELIDKEEQRNDLSIELRGKDDL